MEYAGGCGGVLGTPVALRRLTNLGSEIEQVLTNEGEEP